MKRFALAVIIVAATACREAVKPPVVGDAALADTAEQIAFDVRMNMTHSGVKRGELFADTMFVFNDQTVFLMKRVRANFHTDQGMPNGNLRGDRGTYHLRSKILEGFGNVVVVSTKGERLTSPHLRYVEPTNQVSSDSAYRLIRKGPNGDEVQTGIGFTSDPNLVRFKCKSACGGSAPDMIKQLPRP
jgi:LPS export ABC transporter protein LptC